MVFKNHLAGYSIVLSPAAERTLKKLDKKLALTIKDKLSKLTTGEQNLDVKKMKNAEQVYRLRTGKIRIIYEVWENKITVYILAIGHRKEVYEKQ